MLIKTPTADQAGRLLVWTHSASLGLPTQMTGLGIKELWVGRVSRKYPNMLRGLLDAPVTTLYIGMSKGIGKLPLPFFVWQIHRDRRIIGEGTAETKEAAAEAAFYGWYKLHTHEIFKDAIKPWADKEVVLLGNWLSADEYHKAPDRIKNRAWIIPEIYDAPPDLASVFVLGWPVLQKKKARAKISKVLRDTRRWAGESGFDYTITLHDEHDAALHRNTVITNSLDWYVRKPEQYVPVEAELLCNGICKRTIFGGLSEDGRYVRGMGWYCGVCRDWLQEYEDVDPGLWD